MTEKFTIKLGNTNIILDTDSHEVKRTFEDIARYIDSKDLSYIHKLKEFVDILADAETSKSVKLSN